MDFASMSIGQIHILRVDPGEDVIRSIKQFLEEANVRQAVVLGGYGTLAAHHVHWVAHNRLPPDNVYGRGESGVEILSMNGLVVNGAPHIHVTLATPEGAYGGHLEEGCIAYVLCEMFFAEVEGVTLGRRPVPVSVEGIGQGEVPRLVFEQVPETSG